jgi:hypothetical protein
VNSVLFSARSFQDNLAHVVPGSAGVIRLADLYAVDAQVAELERQTAPQRGEAAQLEQQAAAAQRELDNARDAIAALQARILTQTSELETLAGLTPAAGAGAFDPVDIAQRLDRVSAQRTAVAQTREGVISVRTDLGKLADAEQALAPKEDELARLEAEKRRAGEFVATSERTILGLKGQFGSDFQRVRNEAQALVASTPFGFGAKIVEMHPTFLSTTLVMIMGALGAILYLFPAYLNRDNRIFFADIVVRLVFGMVVALAFYIVANATLAGFAFVPGGDTGAAGASLNPFTVSLLGIIAGIMADDIASWILKRGRELLGGGFSDASPRGRAGAPSVAVGGAPYADAARDARATTRATPAPGDSPPRGGVVG